MTGSVDGSLAAGFMGRPEYSIHYSCNVLLMTTDNAAPPDLINDAGGAHLDSDRVKLRAMLLDGAQAKATGLGDASYFASLRAGIKTRIEDLPE